MESLAKVAKLLTDAGYQLRDCQNGFLCIVDPTCIWTPLLDFIETAWIVLTCVTAILLIGWAVTLMRGASHSMAKNIVSLTLIFGTLSVAIPVMNVMGAGKVIVNQCDTIKVPQDQIQKLLDLNKSQLSQPVYEDFEIWDSNFDTPESLEDDEESLYEDNGLDI